VGSSPAGTAIDFKPFQRPSFTADAVIATTLQQDNLKLLLGAMAVLAPNEAIFKRVGAASRSMHPVCRLRSPGGSEPSENP
jgi:hypothetical protein